MFNSLYTMVKLPSEDSEALLVEYDVFHSVARIQVFQEYEEEEEEEVILLLLDLL